MSVGMASETVLLVSEDPEARRLWAGVLGHTGLVVVPAGSTAAALLLWEQGGYDLIVIDVGALPEGLDLCRCLRARAVAPILLLCPSGNENQSVLAYAAGADECIPKPVSAAVLLAKVRAWLRHRWTLRAESLQPLQAGGLRLDPARREVSVTEGATVRLSVLEFRLLYLLMSQPGHVLPPDVLVTRVWGPAGGGDRRQLKHVVQHLRRRIEPNPRRPRLIRAVREQGYVFAGRRRGRTATPAGELRPLETASMTGL
jgi:DNA-binding response OmpR family regulator